MECGKSVRRLSEENHQVKRIKLNDDDDDDNRIKLDNLPDDVLYILLSSLDSTSIYNLTMVSNRFNVMCNDECYWRKIDARRKPITTDMMKHCLKRINKNTTQLLLAGNKRIDNIFSLPESIKMKECQSLRVLALENQTINGEHVNLNQFPEALEELSLRRSFILSSIKFFKQTCSSMCKLKVLILDHCKWFTAEHLLPISRYQDLEILSLYMCKNLTDEISYISICYRFGFKNLKILNIRFIGMGDQILKSMYNHTMLQEIYFQNYVETYKKSCKKRKSDILDGALKEDVAYLSDDDVTMDVVLNKYFPDSLNCTKKYEVVTRRGISLYRLSFVNSNVEKYVPNFVLYKNQYDECKCGFFERFFDITEELRKPSDTTQESSKTSDTTTDTLDNLIIDNVPLMLSDMSPTPENELMRAAETGNLMKEATPENYAHWWLFVRKPLNDYEISIYENIPPNAHKCFEIYGDSFRMCQENKTKSTNDDAGPSGLNNQTNKNDDDTENSTSSLNCTVVVDSYCIRRRLLGNSRGINHYPCRILAPPLPIDEEHVHVQPALLYLNRAFVNAESPDKFPVSIKKLSFRGYKTVDDDCLNSVCHLKLDLLDVTGTNVTNVGLYFFMITNPQCRVLHERACTCEPRMHF